MLYFAYGSNMLTTRLRERIQSATFFDCGFLRGKRVLFNKRSRDDSGKANLEDSPDAVTWGVIYEIDDGDMDTLDRIEGGYDRCLVQICRPDGDAVEAVTYVSNNLTDDPTAYDWYKQYLLSGAREHNLPQDYIAELEQLPSRPDLRT